jgi:rubrerythrin
LLKTTSQLISFHGKLEDSLSTQLKSLADRHPDLSEKLYELAEENTRHKEMVQRVYREGVTDAFEVGFLTNPLNEDEYIINLLEGNIEKAVKKAIENEDSAIRFCRDAAEKGSQLIPNLSQTFKSLIKRKERRKIVIENLLRN